jgi:hypothetical protein
MMMNKGYRIRNIECRSKKILRHSSIVIRQSIFVFLLFCLPNISQGMETNSDQPFIRAGIEPTSVTAGQPVTVTIEVLAPNWFTKAPEFPDIEVDNAIAMPPGRSLNFTEKVGSVTYAGQSRSYIIYPLTAGTFKVPPVNVTFSYAKEPPKSSPPVTVSSQFQQFEATVPDEAAGLRYFIATSNFTLEHTVSRNISDLKVGDSFKRSITMSAQDVVAMVLPPLRFEPFQGVGIYPDQPVLADKGGERGEIRTGKRTESVTYVLEKEGDYVLPEINVFWWDLKKEKLQKETVLAIKLAVIFNPDLEAEQLALMADVSGQPPAAGTRTLGWRHLIALVVFMGFSISMNILWKKYKPLYANWSKSRKAQKANSEAAYFKRFHKACITGDKKETYNQLMSWLDRIYDGTGSATIWWFVNVTGNPELEEQVDELTNSLFAEEGVPVKFSLSHFHKYIARARKSVLHKKKSAALSHTGLTSLNP